MARKVFEPGLVVPGATFNGKEWAMPAPSQTVPHKVRGFKGKGKTKVVREGVVEVPVYRGIGATVARAMRSQWRRAQRLQRAVEAATASMKELGSVEIPDDLVEELTEGEAQ